MPSYSDILFGKIVVKNGLAPLAIVQECLQIQDTSRARGVVMSLPEIMVARAAISDEQARLASRAQALTQLQRAESIYAKIVHERSLVPFKVLQDCFAEQKLKRFTVRISQLLLERRLLTPEQNDDVMEEQLVRLGEETRQQEEAGVAGSTSLMEDSKVQKLQSEQSKLQDLQASTFRNASMRGVGQQGSGSSTGTGANPALTRAQVSGSRPPAPTRPKAPSPPPRPAVPDTKAEITAADEERSGRTMELDVPAVFPGVAAAPVHVDDLKNWGSSAPSSRSRSQDARPRATPAGPAEPGSLLGKTISSRYRILDKIGEGGMGTVYKAEHCLMEKIVAFKVLHPHLIANKQSLERFRREVRAASKFQHKNVIQIYDAGEGEGGIFYMAMEFVEGESLEAILQKTPMPFERTCVILRQVLKALGEAHKKGIVHRDMKSDNIMIAKDKRGEDLVKVMDFGIAKVLEGADSNADGEAAEGERVYKTMEGVITGTPQYMSPEQAEGKKVDHRADLYSLGIIMFEMVTGQLPFQSETAMGFLGKHIVEEPPLPSSVKPELKIPPAFEKIVMRLLEKDPDKRHQSAGEIFDEFEATVTNEFLDVRPGTGSISGEQVKPRAVVEKKGGGIPVALFLVIGAALFVIALGLVVAVVVLRKPGKDEIVATALRDSDASKVKGEKRRALEILKAALVAAPGDPRLVEAVKAIGEVEPDPRAQADALVKEADAAAAAGDKASLEKAALGLEKAAALAPEDATIRSKLEKVRGELKRVSDVPAPKATLKDLLAEASRARTAGEADKARTAFEAALALSPADPEVKLEGRRRDADAEHALALATKEPKAARPHLVEAIKLQPDEGVRALWQKELDATAEPVTPPPPPPPPVDPGIEARAKSGALLDRARDALVALDLESAKAALDEASPLMAAAGADSQRRFDARTAALVALRDLRPKLDATRAELTAMSQKLSDANEKRLAAARARIDDNARGLGALADTEVAKALEPRIKQDRDLADQVKDALPKPGAQNEEALTRWRKLVRSCKEEQLPELERKRNGEKVIALLDGLRSNPAFTNATADEQTWVRTALTSYSSRAKAWAKIPARYVSIRGGAYTLGRGANGKPAETVTLPDYSIDSNECTMEDWAIYLEATSDQDPSPRKPEGFRGRTDDPLTNVTADDVRLYAAWLTKKADNLVTFRLPTEGEWENAARGKAGLDFPWGPGFRPDRDEGRLALKKIVRVRSFEPNDLEIYDTAGNASELTATLIGTKRVVKGGNNSPEQAAASARELVDKDDRNTKLGFRLVAIEGPPRK